MSEPEIDIAALVEAAVPAYWSGDPDDPRSRIRAILTAVLPLVLAGPREALKPFADTADWLKPDLPDDFDTTKVLGLPLGDCRLARSTLTRIEALLKDESRGTEDG